MSTVGEDFSSNKKFIEITFPVPWGAIAAKTWGDPCLSPVLMVHGIQDNANTFDRIIPYLPDCFYYVCLDLPGHGKSSRFPSGIILDFKLYLSSIRRVVFHLRWSKFIFIGHSYGGQLGSYYSAMYPEEVTKLVMLDTLAPTIISPDNFLRHCRKIFEQLVEFENKLLTAEPPNYTYEEAISRVISGRNSPISRIAAETLAARSLKKNKNNFYYFSTDQRLKFRSTLFATIDLHLNIIKSIQCPVLLIITDVLLHYVNNCEKKSYNYETLKVFQSKSTCQMVEVHGYHDVHNCSPEIVAPHIVKFLLNAKSNL